MSNNTLCSYVLSPTCQIPMLNDLYKMFLGYRTDGYFVELGAYDGEYVSNTSGLADLGWSGLYIEPVKQYYEACVERHRNNDVQVLRCAIGSEEKEIVIQVGGPLSSMSEETIACFQKIDWAKGFYTGEREYVSQYKLDDILFKSQVPNKFDILSVDVEGYELQVFKGFNINNWKPKLVIVELHDNNYIYPHQWDECDQIDQYLRNNNYRVIYKDYSNTVFLNNEVVRNNS